MGEEEIIIFQIIEEDLNLEEDQEEEDKEN